MTRLADHLEKEASHPSPPGWRWCLNPSGDFLVHDAHALKEIRMLSNSEHPADQAPDTDHGTNAAAQQIGALTQVLKRVYWQSRESADYGSAWLASELYREGLRVYPDLAPRRTDDGHIL